MIFDDLAVSGARNDHCWMAFTFQPLSMNSTASQSSSSGCDWPFALRTEVIHGLNDAEAEIRLPVTIHGDTRGERVRAIRHPARKAEPIGRPIGWRLRQGFRHARRNLLAGAS